MRLSKVFVVLIGGAVIGTAFYIYHHIMKLVNAPFKVNGVKNINVSGSNINFTLITQITNNGDLSAHVKDQYYEIFINDKLISTVHNNNDVLVGANEASIIPLNIDLKFNELIKLGLANLTDIIANPSKIKLSIKGYFNWKAGIISAKQPFELNYTLKQIMDLSKSTPTPATKS